MSASLSAYTNLESLLLFQSLHAHGVGSTVFSRISELLKNNPSIREDKTFQIGRLSPDALRNFYLSLLKDEIRSERQDGLPDGDSQNGQNGDVKISRKRKAPSPSLPTVQEASKHTHLIPKLVNKLYARYRTALTHEIRDDEDRYDRLQRELSSIERGERDNELREASNGRSPSPSLSRKSPSLHQKALDGSRLAPPSAKAHTLAGSMQRADPKSAISSQNGPVKTERTVKNGPLPSQTVLPGNPSTPQALPGPGPVPVPSNQQSRTPQPLAPPPQFQSQQQPRPNTGFNGAPPPAHRSPYPPQQPQPQTQINQAKTSSGTPQASSAYTQTPPLNTSSVAQSQGQPMQPYGGNGVSQHGQGGGPSRPFSPSQQRPQGPYPPGPQSPSMQTQTLQQQRPFYPYPGQSPYPPQQSHANQPPPQGGFMLPPFQVSPQDPSRAHQQLGPPQYPQVSTPVSRQLHPSPKTAVASNTRSALPPIQPPVFQPRGSIGTPSNVHSPFSSLSTPRSAKTVWKASGSTFTTPPAPRPEVSPIDDIAPFGQQKPAQPKTKAQRKPRAKAKAKETESTTAIEPQAEQSEQTEDHVPESESGQGRTRRRAATRRTRPRSIASSQAGGSIRDRSRSQSILSHTETVAGENESQAGTRVKSERGASIGVIEEDTVDVPSQPTTRRRRGTTQSLQTRGRKRNVQEAALTDSEDQPGTPGLPKTVIAPRHFSRMCVPIMNDIGSHRHASTFTTAVRAKDAEGYYEIIKRPTDLKSIQKAIAAGAKAVASAATDTPVGSPGGAGGGFVELPLSADVMPPKAIVNSAQLEKELMRMFVNAIMFNNGEEGVVEDARQMYATCEQSVSNWRSAERSSGKLEVEETPPVVPEDEAPAPSKRRKL